MRDPKALITTEQLAAILGAPGVRTFDCTTVNTPPPPGVDEPYLPVPALDGFRQAHIPGAGFLDLQGDFSDKANRAWFMLPGVDQLEAAFAKAGIGAGCRVVLYSVGTMMWATRFWWMLRAMGFDEAAVLDGGLDKWRAEGRPTESGDAAVYPPAIFKAKPRPGLFVDKSVALAAIGQPGTVTINALGPAFHAGLEPSRYGRPGRIPGSVNVSAATLVDPQTKGFTGLADAAAKFAAKGVTPEKQVICYCGGGISATVDLFLMHQLGYDKLALYDASMGEWAKDPSLPIETD